MRVVAGRLRGKSILGPNEANKTIRPTSDRAKEALFSFLRPYPKGSFLDLCSGSGSMALEAYSRGYEAIVAIDNDPDAINLIRLNCGEYPVDIIRHDIFNIKELKLSKYDVVFLDPPYEQISKYWEKISFCIPELLNEGGLFILESDESFIPVNSVDISLLKTKNYGRNHFHIFTRNS